MSGWQSSMNNWIDLARQDGLQYAATRFLRDLFARRLPNIPVYLFGSRARSENLPHSDFDFWIDAELDPILLAELREQIEESFMPYSVDIVLPSKMKGYFADNVKKDAIQWQ